jgi:hypothetical protein
MPEEVAQPSDLQSRWGFGVVLTRRCELVSVLAALRRRIPTASAEAQGVGGPTKTLTTRARRVIGGGRRKTNTSAVARGQTGSVPEGCGGTGTPVEDQAGVASGGERARRDRPERTCRLIVRPRVTLGPIDQPRSATSCPR